MTIRLGVNIDHVATLRQARGIFYPDPVQAAFKAIKGGADGITLHLREDRRHIQDADVFTFKETLNVPMNLEIAATHEMVAIAESIQPAHVCLVPEKRHELTTEGGLNVVAQIEQITEVCMRLTDAHVMTSLFIDPDKSQIDAAKRCGASVIELHTGVYANATNVSDPATVRAELKRIVDAADYAHSLGLIVNAGHGLHIENVQAIAAIACINELNIGHSIIARALFIGMQRAVEEMKVLMLTARGQEVAV